MTERDKEIMDAVSQMFNQLGKDLVGLYKILLLKGVITETEVRLVGTESLFNILFGDDKKQAEGDVEMQKSHQGVGQLVN